MSRKKGPLPRFTETHVNMVLNRIAKYGRVGRKQLTEDLGIGEGSMRTILNQLKKQNLITSSRGGHEITRKGKQIIEKPAKFTRLDADDITVGEVDVATLVKGAAARVKSGIEQRDEAIKVGADGATVLILRAGKLQFPDGFRIVNPKLDRALTDIFKPDEGDVIVIGTANDVVKAEIGARAAAHSLVKSKYS